MIVVLILIFALVGLAAAGFVVLPLFRGKREKATAWLAVGSGLGVMALGLGIYAILGQPKIALVSLTGPSQTDYPALIATLARQMPNRPGDLQGWTLLGRGYATLGNAAQAEKALARAIDVAKAQDGRAPPDLLSEYAQALTEENGGVTKEAEAAFREAVEENPNDLISRYFIGLALKDRGDKDGALKTWQAVLAEAPPNAPWRGDLVNEMAALTAQSGGGAPNPMAMVAQLASRLESSPNDLNGWLMLIRAYKVLGQVDKAKEALAKARDVFANQADAQTALSQEAKEIALD
ncbi:MAG TPA: tetratricopeptide repeat protein [Micropepsaceae bacterium]|nr:tetratricopeptide repeat protein [Micropepsaceae bacterium]